MKLLLLLEQMATHAEVKDSPSHRRELPFVPRHSDNVNVYLLITIFVTPSDGK